jgi:hypothetical protein
MQKYFYILRLYHMHIKIGQTTFSCFVPWNNYQGFRVYAKTVKMVLRKKKWS